MKTRMFNWLPVVFVAMLLALAAATGGQVQTPGGDSRLSGEFQATVYCYIDQNLSRTEYTLTTAAGKEYTLVFHSEAEVPTPGSWLNVSGKVIGDTVHVDYFTEFMPDGGNPTTGEQRFIVALVNFQDAPTQNVTVEQVETRLFDPDYSADAFWREGSFGKMWATGDVVGWITLPINRQCNPSRVRQYTIAALDEMVYLPQYNRLLILIPQAGGCGWGGLGTLGMQTFQTRNGPWRTTTSWIRSEYYNEDLHNPSRAVFVTVHEVGHNLGEHHSRSVVWTQSRALGPFDCEACGGSFAEYGDPYSSLGGSWRTGHFNTEHKERLAWFEPENLVIVTRTGVYPIDAYEVGSNVPKALKIHRGYGPATGIDEYVYVEWRQPIGFDTDINYFNGATYDGVVMHYEFGHPQTAAYMLDMTPGDSELRNATLRTGVSWTDVYTNLTITPRQIAGGRMFVEVTIGEPLLPLSYTITRGFHISGGLPDVFSSDDGYLTVRDGPGLTSADAVIQIEFETQYTGAAPGAFRFELEARTGSPVLQRLELYNYSTGLWETVDERDSTMGDSFVEANVWQNTWRYIGAAGGPMKARVSWFYDRPVRVYPITASIDQAVWKILR